MSTYLKKYYLDDRKLAQRALLEFYRALRSNRMIAFTGAMTTEAFGYPGWSDLIKTVKEYARELAQANSRAAPSVFDRIDDLTARFDKRVGMSMIGEYLEQLDQENASFENLPSTVQKLRQQTLIENPKPFAHLRDRHDNRLDLMELKLANILRRPGKPIAPRNGSNLIDIPFSLWRHIGIERFATLNFDLELERMLMLTPEEQQKIGPKKTTFAKLIELFRTGAVEWGEASKRITRVLPNGRTAISDVLSRERSDRLIDFAMGSDEAEQHVIHLHGRCDDQRSLVFSYRDYDQLYRRIDLHRSPFEYGQRIMIGGNPVLFVGLGMTESEINKVLEDFISNTPYHRSAPTFLLWNTRNWNEKKTDDREANTPAQMSPIERANFRTDKLHRLGVFTIFDTDVIQDSVSKLVDLKCEKDRPALLQNLQTLTNSVADASRTIGRRERYVGRRWRSMRSRMEQVSQTKKGTLWEVIYPKGSTISRQKLVEVTKFHRDLLKKSTGKRPNVIFAIASAGWGKGQIGSKLSEMLSKEKERYVLHINAGFCFDSDSFLDGIARFLEQVNGVAYGDTERSRDRYFERINLRQAVKAPVYCIINGIDRFIDVNGVPLSAEFDRFIHQLTEDNDGPPETAVKWLFLGSDRTRLYLDRLRSNEPAGSFSPNLQVIDLPTQKMRFTPRDKNLLASEYLEAIKRTMNLAAGRDFCSPSQTRAIESANHVARDRSGEARRISIERLRRAFLDAYLDQKAFIACGLNRSNAELAMEILRALAFIGVPAEASVLQNVPRIFKRLDTDRNGQLSSKEIKKINSALAKLDEWRLVIKVRGFEQSEEAERRSSGRKPDNCRYGLHRAVMTELRYRLGLPLSEAKLSTAFNMSLYVAQPVDGYIPEPGIHDELGELIDALVVAYKRPRDGGAESLGLEAEAFFNNQLKACAPYNFADEGDKDDAARHKFHRRCQAENVACLRAALAVVRGYYSTTGLLTLDRTDRLIGEDRDGILLEHAERLDDLIDAYGKTAEMRDGLRDEYGDKGSERFKSVYGQAEPLYPDELVWLHNERAVVRLAMGDLPEANRSFQKALTVNKMHVEYGDRSHNWRRIKLNQLTVEIEGGELFTAERLAREVLDASGWPVEMRVASVAEAQAQFKKMAEKKDRPSGDPRSNYFLQEDRLATAIALGYRGTCAHLRGELLDACDDLRVATGLLRKLDEHRAFAYFTRQFAAALLEVGDRTEAARQLELASDVAQSTRQMDLVYRTQIMRAQWDWQQPDAENQRKLKAASEIANAMDYGIKAGVHRVRVEAARALSKLKLESGDFEVALQYASEAITIATRYVLKLQMMSARVRLGRIMIRRGDRNTGRSLIQGAIRSANRAGFQRVVDAGQAALDEIA